MQKPNSTSSLAALAAAVSLAFGMGSMALAQPTSAPGNDSVIETTFDREIGSASFSALVTVGTPGHDWVRTLTSTHTLADTIALKVSHPVDLDVSGNTSLQERILKRSGVAKDLGVPVIPEPDFPGRPGLKTAVNASCMQIGVGTNPSVAADIRYEWEWRNRDDTDGDGKADSNPGWVLVSVTVTILNVETAALC